jgi:hypothetical protein
MEQDKKRNLNIGCGIVFCAFLMVWIIGEIRSAPKDTEYAVRRSVAEKAEAKKKIAEEQAAMPASEHIKAGELALGSERSNDTRPPLALPGQKALKPVITDDQWDSTRQRLNLVKPEQPEYPKAQQMLKAMAASDKRKAAADAKKEAAEAVKDRKAFAKRLEENFLEQRINADVTVSGRDNTTLTIRWALASKVTARDLDKSGIVDQAGKAGFKKIWYTDGFNFTVGWGFD